MKHQVIIEFAVDGDKAGALFNLSRERAAACFDAPFFWPKTSNEAAYEAFVASNSCWPAPIDIGISIGSKIKTDPLLNGFDADDHARIEFDLDIEDIDLARRFLKMEGEVGEGLVAAILLRQVCDEIVGAGFQPDIVNLDGNEILSPERKRAREIAEAATTPQADVGCWY
jgi:hypothetical protein